MKLLSVKFVHAVTINGVSVIVARSDNVGNFGGYTLEADELLNVTIAKGPTRKRVPSANVAECEEALPPATVKK